MDLQLSSRTALVTGGASGIGLATAKQLAAEGANIIINGRASDELESSVEDIQSVDGAGRVEYVAADLARLEEVEHLHDRCRELFGTVDIVAHAAGIHGANGDFMGLTDDDWMQTIDVDLMAAVRVCRAFIPDMREQGWGRIVLVASENAVQPYVDDMPYNACKAAIVNLTKGLSKAYSPDGVLINVVSPAFIATPMTDEMMDELAEERNITRDEAVQWFLENERPGITAGRRGKPEEVAAVIAFLCGETATFVTGSNYRVDGGSVHTAFS